MNTHARLALLHCSSTQSKRPESPDTASYTDAHTLSYKLKYVYNVADGHIDTIPLRATQLEQMYVFTQDLSSPLAPPVPFARDNSSLRVAEVIFNLESNERTHLETLFCICKVPLDLH